MVISFFTALENEGAEKAGWVCCCANLCTLKYLFENRQGPIRTKKIGGTFSNTRGWSRFCRPAIHFYHKCRNFPFLHKTCSTSRRDMSISCGEEGACPLISRRKAGSQGCECLSP